MAKIKGIQLKGVKFFPGHDGVPGFAANIYLDNKKIGDVYDDSWGGPWLINFDDKAKELLFNERIEAYYKENPADFEDGECFIAELLELHDLEKEFKKSVKEGFPFLLHMTFEKRKRDGIDAPVKLPVIMSVKTDDAINRSLEKHKPVVYKLFKTLDDFIVA